MGFSIGVEGRQIAAGVVHGTFHVYTEMSIPAGLDPDTLAYALVTLIVQEGQQPSSVAAVTWNS